MNEDNEEDKDKLESENNPFNENNEHPLTDEPTDKTSQIFKNNNLIENQTEQLEQPNEMKLTKIGFYMYSDRL